MIEAVHLSKEFARPVKEEGTEKKSGFSFGKKTMESFYAVDDLSFRAKKGEILGILGPNGAGKTTLLRMLGHLMTPTKGEVIVSDEEGNPITDEVKIKQAIGYLSNNTALYGRLTAREMFMLFGEIYGISKEDSAKRANEIFHLLEMEEFCDK